MWAIANSSKSSVVGFLIIMPPFTRAQNSDCTRENLPWELTLLLKSVSNRVSQLDVQKELQYEFDVIG